ncbi:MAG: FUSC family protein, partial [Candidatus Auribacterota bacterium]|nr:FUSC family protein [Candidatus Auribacterota bacterium]
MQLGFDPIQLSFKTALAAVIAIVLAMWFRWEKPYWSGITVLVVMLPYIGASLQKSFLRLAGTWAGALVGVLISVVFIQSPLPFTIALAILILFFIYLSRSNYAVVLGVGTMVIIVFSGLGDRMLSLRGGYPGHSGCPLRQPEYLALESLGYSFQ